MAAQTPASVEETIKNQSHLEPRGENSTAPAGFNQAQQHQTSLHEPNPSGGPGTSTITTTGATVRSSDPSTEPDASMGTKVMGDVKGAVGGVVGSMQAATGAMLRNKNMEEQGMKKMSEEDERLGAKRGVMPVGSGTREEQKDA